MLGLGLGLPRADDQDRPRVWDIVQQVDEQSPEDVKKNLPYSGTKKAEKRRQKEKERVGEKNGVGGDFTDRKKKTRPTKKRGGPVG